MRKILHIILGVLLVVFLVAQGAGLIYVAYADQACWDRCLALLQRERGLGVLVGIGLIFVVIAYFLTGIKRRSPGGEEFLTFKNDGGTVSIGLRAVNEFISKLDAEFAAILSLKPTITPRCGGVAIDLDVRVKAGTQIPELCQLLQERVRESMRQSMGITDIRRIRVNVKDIVGTVPPADPTDVELDGQAV